MLSNTTNTVNTTSKTKADRLENNYNEIIERNVFIIKNSIDITLASKLPLGILNILKKSIEFLEELKGLKLLIQTIQPSDKNDLNQKIFECISFLLDFNNKLYYMEFKFLEDYKIFNLSEFNILMNNIKEDFHAFFQR